MIFLWPTPGPGASRSRSMFSYLLDPGTIAKARTPMAMCTSLVMAEERNGMFQVVAKRQHLYSFMIIYDFIWFPSIMIHHIWYIWNNCNKNRKIFHAEKSNQCGVTMSLHFIMLDITNCSSSSCLSMFIRLLLSCCIQSQCIRSICPLCLLHGCISTIFANIDWLQWILQK